MKCVKECTMSCMFFSRCYSAHDRKLRQIFGWYGRCLSKHPWLVIIFSIIINLICSIGILNFELERNLESQYYLDNSRAFKDREFINKNFQISENNFQPHALSDLGYFAEIIFKSKGNRNIFEENSLSEIYKTIDTTVYQMAVKESNTTYTFQELCAKFQNKCVILGLEILSKDFQRNLLNNKITYPHYRQTSLSNIVARPNLNGSVLISAEMIRFKFYLSQMSERKAMMSRLWIREFISFISGYKTNETEMVYLYHNAMADEVERSGIAEAHLFPFTLILMIVYASIATSGKRVDCVYDVQNLGRIGVLVALLSMLPAVGIASAFGQKFMTSSATIPFLIIGIGIDDMFIIMSGYADTIEHVTMTIEKRIERTLMTSGLSITITSLTDIITFLVGYASVYTPIKNFCVYTAVFFCYLNQLTILTPCLVLHQRRIDKEKHVYTCRKTKSKDELLKEGRSQTYITCCSGEKPKSRADMESLLETYPKKVVQFIVKHSACRIISLILYVLYLVLAIIGAKDLKQSTKYSDLALIGSNYYKANIWDYENYPLELPFQVIFTSPLNYSDAHTINDITKLVQGLKNCSLVKKDTEINWISAFRYYSQLNPPESYDLSLHNFLNVNNLFKNDVVFSSDNKTISASRLYLFSQNVRTSEMQAAFIQETREVCDASGLPCTVYSPLFMFCEQYLNMIDSALQTVGIAVAAMFVVTCVFMPLPIIVLIVTSSMVSILTGVFGFLKLWGLDISVVTMIELVVSVGFSVDFSAHICHAYLSSKSRDRLKRVTEAIDLAGGPIINIALATIIGLSLLASSKSFIFQSFFKVLFLVVIFGLIHGALLVPIILVYIGPKVRILPSLKEKLLIKNYSRPLIAQSESPNE